MTGFFIAALLLLRVLPGDAETEEEEITGFLYDYALRFGDYLYATTDYYSENTTLIPTMYSYEVYLQDPQESLGSPLRCHLPLLVLLGLLRLLL